MVTKKAKKPIAVIYARAQTSAGAEGQLRVCRAWAEKHGYTVAKEYFDKGKSASRTLEWREGQTQLIRDAISKQPSFNFIIVYNFNRLFRTAFDYFIVKNILEREHLDYVTQPMIASAAALDFVVKDLVVVPIGKFYHRNISCEPVVLQKQTDG